MTSPEAPRFRAAADEAPRVGWRFLGSRRWVGYFALFLVFSIACVLLGNWQFDRRAEARAEIARIDRNYDAAAMPLTEAVPDIGEFDEALRKWQPVEVTGEYIGEPFLARNRPGADGVGSNVIQALRLEDGNVFFVDRGWVPVTGAEDVTPRLPRPADGEVTVLARLRASEPAIAGREASGHSVPSIDVPMMGGIAGLDPTTVYLGVFGQLAEEEPAGETGVLAERPERDEGPHLSYALQWYVFIVIAGVGLIYASRQEYRTLNAGEAAVQRDAERRAERRRRRGPSDAEEEDALLDG